MRVLLIAAVLASGCGGDDAASPHNEVTCDHQWFGNIPAEDTTCEVACNVEPVRNTQLCGANMCDYVVEFEGTRGCCAHEGGIAAGVTIRWEACE